MPSSSSSSSSSRSAGGRRCAALMRPAKDASRPVSMSNWATSSVCRSSGVGCRRRRATALAVISVKGQSPAMAGDWPLTEMTASAVALRRLQPTPLDLQTLDVAQFDIETGRLASFAGLIKAAHRRPPADLDEEEEEEEEGMAYLDKERRRAALTSILGSDLV